MTLEHEHGLKEIRARLAEPKQRGDLRDAVYGAIDGAVTTFAIVAGVQGAGLSSTIILALGIANVLADGFSMAAANYSGTKTELDDLARLRAIEERHIAKVPEGERLELREILRDKGLSGQVLEDATDMISHNRTAWIDIMLVDEYGMSPTLPNPMRAAMITFISFLVAGIIPLAPFILDTTKAFEISIAATLTVFFVIGTLKSRWSMAKWWRSGLETLLIGSTAALIAYLAGSLFEGTV
ncbi:VIT1/CCC1 transporter family protein [Rhodobacteraceae bacterium NNCM2]|nr:VIT1/CCC1 transporter family protein [Coraliihabitans acroporae]